MIGIGTVCINLRSGGAVLVASCTGPTSPRLAGTPTVMSWLMRADALLQRRRARYGGLIGTDRPEWRDAGVILAQAVADHLQNKGVATVSIGVQLIGNHPADPVVEASRKPKPC